MKTHLSIDLETFSSVDITKAGAHKYVESPDFEILLLAYSVGDQPAQILDFTQGDTLPAWLDKALEDEAYIKHAFNAVFEWLCLSKCYGRALPLDQWRCTMAQARYCGYPGSLEAVGRALGLPPGKQKLSTGKALIRYFCNPCQPTKTNGGRRRNLPKHDPGRWELFKAYCLGDVVAEQEVARRFSAFPLPEALETQWQLDTLINSRGVAVDLDLMRGALAIDLEIRENLTQEAQALTGLDNPNSIHQLGNWVGRELGKHMTDLRKDSVLALLERENLPSQVRRALEIRQELGKTSTKKYKALEATVCEDGRVRGLLQFYGANRTGRWAGRLVQVQNLPRTYLTQLDLARDIVKAQKGEGLHILFGSVQDTLSQLIRTAFIAGEGCRLIDADFSAIEARVIAWLAGEQWRLEVFKTHGKIYEASASQMFGVPLNLIQKGNPEYELRQKGKVAELALGYQGSTGALISMGALDMGIPEAELPDIVSRWREANTRIVALWYALEKAAISVLQTGCATGVQGLILARELDVANDLDFLTITLPSQRKLYYAKPQLGVNPWGRPSLQYHGLDQTTKQWGPLDTYGGKLTENVVQAIARDCLACAIENLEAAGFPIVFHVHDEVVIDFPQATEEHLKQVVEIMSRPMPWAPGLSLGADGWVDDYFKKD